MFGKYDITFCKATDCPLKDKCVRHTRLNEMIEENPSVSYYSLFTEVPYDKESESCKNYWEVE